jgi:hypothetical protein
MDGNRFMVIKSLSSHLATGARQMMISSLHTSPLDIVVSSYMPAICCTFTAIGVIAVNTTMSAPKTLTLGIAFVGSYAKDRLLRAAARGSVVSNWAVEIAEALIPNVTPLVT